MRRLGVALLLAACGDTSGTDAGAAPDAVRDAPVDVTTTCSRQRLLVHCL